MMLRRLHRLVRRLSAVAPLILVAALLGGCATTPYEAPPEIVRKAASVGVKSVAADQAWLAYVGITVFENSQQTLPIDAWLLDERVEREAVTLLRNAGIARVVALEIDRQSVRDAVRKAVRTPFSGGLEDSAPIASLIAAARQQNLQYLLVLVPRPVSSDYVAELRAPGFNIAGRGSFAQETPSSVIAEFCGSWILIDVQPGRWLSETMVREDPHWDRSRAVRPRVKLEHAQWPKDFKTVDGERIAQARAAMESLVPRIAGTLKRVLDPPPEPEPQRIGSRH